MSRKKTKPNLLDQIAAGEDAPQRSSRPTTENVAPATPEPTKTQPKKIGNTYYLTQETSYQLEEAKLQLRRLTESKVSKSDIIEAALILAMEELSTRGGRSQLSILLSNY